MNVRVAVSIMKQADRIQIMRKGVQTGLAGTDYEDLWQSGRYAELERQGKLLGDADPSNDELRHCRSLTAGLEAARKALLTGGPRI